MLTLYRKNKSTRGFTLIELLVVIAIIGVLASIVLASLNNARRKSRDARRIVDMKQIGLALQLYLDGVGVSEFPLGNATCDATDDYGLRSLVAGGYIPSVPRDPSDPAVCYRYASGEINGLLTTYHLGAVLEDPANSAFSGDRDCSSDGTNTPNCDENATWAGALINGNDSANCTDDTAAGTDQCYDAIP